MIGLPLFALTIFVAPLTDTDRFVEERMRRANVPGLALAVVKDGKVVKLKGYGLADREKKLKVGPTTPFRLASVTKQFVAAGIMLLVQDGKVALDDPIGRYVEGTPESWRSITLRRLLTQTTGIRDFQNEGLIDVSDDTTPQAMVQAAAAAPMAFEAGARWSYSNTNYVLLAMVIEKVSGEAHDAFLARRIFRPLGMASTRRGGEAAKGYAAVNGPLRPIPFHLPTGYGAGGFVSTAADLAKWDLSLRGNAILSDESKRLMWSPAVLNDGSTYGYGFGWNLMGTPEHPTVEHGGDLPGVAAYFVRYVGEGLSVIVLSNGMGAASGIAKRVAQRYLPSLVPEIKPIRLPKGELKAREGLYWTAANGLIRLQAEKGSLDVFIVSRNALIDEFVPVGNARFASFESPRGLEFDAKGATITWSGGTKAPFVRLGPLPRDVRPQPGDPSDDELRVALSRPTQGIEGWVREGVPELTERASLRVLGSFDVSKLGVVGKGGSRCTRHIRADEGLPKVRRRVPGG